MPGPPPKRSDQRRRQNKPKSAINTAPGAKNVAVPAADAKWHPVARRWYQSLKKSGQAAFYEPSDWATAFLVAESISRELMPQPMSVGVGDAAHIEMVKLPPKGASLAAWLKAMSSLMVTEGDRRRMHLELERGVADDGEGADVSDIADYRRRLESQ
ncbi:MAG: hypothetical protein Q8K63_13790 [Acidimicrobiales bacterium]|nr:hypothetical protein [Acidimicrobiales bacterium]